MINFTSGGRTKSRRAGVKYGAEIGVIRASAAAARVTKLRRTSFEAPDRKSKAETRARGLNIHY